MHQLNGTPSSDTVRLISENTHRHYLVYHCGHLEQVRLKVFMKFNLLSVVLSQMTCGDESTMTLPDMTFTLKMATAMFTETLDNTQHSTQLTS
jgi:hypothetical protein